MNPNSRPDRNGPHIEEGEERFRLLVESVRDYAIFMLDPEGRVASWNRGAERIKGYRAGEILGKHFSVFYTPDAIERRWPWQELESATAEGRVEDEGWRVRKDGSRFWANVVITALRDDSGELRGFAKVTRDMTERRENERRIQALNAELERRVVELATSNRELDQKSRENETFVYSVSHDLRQPLVNLQGFGRELSMTSADLRRLLMAGGIPDDLARQLPPPLEAMDESIRYIETAVTHLSQIIDGLLRLSRAGRVESQVQVVDAAKVVDRLVRALHLTVVEHRAQIEVGALPNVMGDASAIEQVFSNLLRNALNYLDPARPGRIEIARSDRPHPQGMVGFDVRDNGVGIPEVSRASIFRAFHRLHPELAPGEGMGLAIVRRIVERHGGHIGFESRVGAGTTFTFTLPEATGA